MALAATLPFIICLDFIVARDGKETAMSNHNCGTQKSTNGWLQSVVRVIGNGALAVVAHTFTTL